MAQRTITCYRMEAEKNPEQNSSSLKCYIYDTVQGDYVDWTTWETVESKTSAKYFQKILSENEDAENIDIYINSAGGSVYEGLAIYNQLKRHKAHKTVYVDGFACSIASVIAMAGDEIIMPRASMMMIHNAWTVAAGNASELRKVADDLDMMSKTIAQSYLDKSNGKLDESTLQALLDAETYLSAEKCVEYGLCDKLSEDSGTEKAKEAVQNSMKTQLEMFTASVRGASASVKAEIKQEEAPEEKEPEVKPAENPAEPAEESAPETKEPQAKKPMDKDEFMKMFTRKAV